MSMWKPETFFLSLSKFVYSLLCDLQTRKSLQPGGKKSNPNSSMLLRLLFVDVVFYNLPAYPKFFVRVQLLFVSDLYVPFFYVCYSN